MMVHSHTGGDLVLRERRSPEHLLLYSRPTPFLLKNYSTFSELALIPFRYTYSDNSRF